MEWGFASMLACSGNATTSLSYGKDQDCVPDIPAKWTSTPVGRDIWSQVSTITHSFDNFVAHFREVFGRPAGDTSVNEQLIHLRQGPLPINVYALKFRTLAAAGMSAHSSPPTGRD